MTEDKSLRGLYYIHVLSCVLTDMDVFQKLVECIQAKIDKLSDAIFISITSSILSGILIANYAKYKRSYYNVFFPKKLKILIETLQLYHDFTSIKIDNYKKKDYDNNQLCNMCESLLESNKFFHKRYNGKYNYNYVKKLFQQSWNNIFQYISLNHDILDNKLKNELCKVIKTIESFDINLPMQYKYITSADEEKKLEQCYIFAYMRFVNSNIDKILDHSDENFIRLWLQENIIEKQYDIRRCYYIYYYVSKRVVDNYFHKFSCCIIQEILLLYLYKSEKLQKIKKDYLIILNSLLGDFCFSKAVIEDYVKMNKQYVKNPNTINDLTTELRGIDEDNVNEKFQEAQRDCSNFNIHFNKFLLFNKILNELIFNNRK